MSFVIFDGKKYKEKKNALGLVTCRIYNMEDVEGLENFPDLKNLNLSNNHITNLRFLKYFKNLEVLNLDRCKVEDLTGIGNCTKIKKLLLYGNPVYKWVKEKFGAKRSGEVQDIPGLLEHFKSDRI